MLVLCLCVGQTQYFIIDFTALFYSRHKGVPDKLIEDDIDSLLKRVEEDRVRIVEVEKRIIQLEDREELLSSEMGLKVAEAISRMVSDISTRLTRLEDCLDRLEDRLNKEEVARTPKSRQLPDTHHSTR